MSFTRVTKLHRCSLLVLVLVLGLGSLSGFSGLAVNVKQLSEKEVVGSFITAVSRTDSKKTAKSNFDEAAQNMDFEEMAKRSFGQSGWPKFTAAEQKEVTALFRRLIEIRYYPRWRRIFQNGHFEIVAQTKQDSDALVTGKLDIDGKKSALTFRLVKAIDGFRLISMSVKDKDLLERTSVRLKRGLSQKGAAGLIAHLKRRTKEAPKYAADKPVPEELISGGK